MEAMMVPCPFSQNKPLRTLAGLFPQVPTPANLMRALALMTMNGKPGLAVKLRYGGGGKIGGCLTRWP